MNQIVSQGAAPLASVGMSETGAGSKIAPQNLGEVVKFAEVMARADIALPKHLRGNPGACMAVAMQAMEWQMNPFAVASKSYVVNGVIAYEAQLIAAVVNTRSGIKGRLKYSFSGAGNDMTCTVTGSLDGEDYSYTSPPVGAITTKNSPLWKGDPQQQLGYYSARAWARRYTPEVILGVYDRDEAMSFQGPDNAKDVTPAPTLAQRLAAKREEAPQEVTEGFSETLPVDVEFESVEGMADITPDEALEIAMTAPVDEPVPSLLDEYREALERCTSENDVSALNEVMGDQIRALPADDVKTARKLRAQRLNEIAGGAS